MEQTICAISTAMGESGIGIVRISGKNALEIGQKIFLPATDIKREHRKLQYGWIINKGPAGALHPGGRLAGPGARCPGL